MKNNDKHEGKSALRSLKRKLAILAALLFVLAFPVFGDPEIYIVGYTQAFEGQDGGGIAIWSNQDIPDFQFIEGNEGEGTCSSVYASDGNVYIAGHLSISWSPIAVLWKNGVVQKLSDNESRADSVYVSGRDVYVAGWIKSGNNTRRATLWKNGVPQTLSDNVSWACSVYVSGRDVYVAGHVGSLDNERATLWKNGVPQTLNNTRSGAYSVHISGGDVYVAGYAETRDSYIATLWKNGVPQTLSNTNSFVSSVYVYGNDVFVAGIIGSRAVYWVNGVPYDLGSYGEANSVFIK